MGLVVSLAKGFKPKNLTELDEYIQAGRIGLLTAIRKHDPERGALSTIAWNHIRWEIMSYLDTQYKKPIPTQPLYDQAAYITIDSIWELLPDTLNPIEERIIELRLQGFTFREIGNQLGGYTRGWANKLFKSSLEKIKLANA